MTFTNIKKFENRACAKCAYYYEEWDGEYCELYCGSSCTRKGQEHYGNLKSFPFLKEKLCFQIDFWHSEFANEFSDNEEINDSLFFKYRQKYCLNKD
jgi:hypothetical protein